MSTRKCPGCGADVPSASKLCPRCGSEMPASGDRTRRLLLRAYNIGCLAMLAVLVAGFVYWLVGVVT